MKIDSVLKSLEFKNDQQKLFKQPEQPRNMTSVRSREKSVGKRKKKTVAIDAYGEH